MVPIFLIERKFVQRNNQFLNCHFYQCCPSLQKLPDNIEVEKKEHRKEGLKNFWLNKYEKILFVIIINKKFKKKIYHIHKKMIK